MFLSTDQKIDALIASFNSLKDSQLQANQLLKGKMAKFKGDLEVAKEN